MTVKAGEEKFVASGNLRLWTERFSDPGDPAVLVIMGTSTTGMGWPDGLVKALLDGGRQVIRFDHRDTARSDCVDFATRPYTPADLAADAMTVLDGHGVATAHVAGSSLGGAIGQWLAVHRPERVLTLLVEVPAVPVPYSESPSSHPWLPRVRGLLGGLAFGVVAQRRAGRGR